MKKPTPNYAASIEFLERFRPEGPWILHAIPPSKKGMAVETITDKIRLLAWLEHYGAEHNVYFAVNPLLRAVSKKAGREDVKSLAWLHVDVDPRAMEDLKAEHKRIRKLMEVPPDGVVPPSVAVFSGGGYQAFWKLKDPLPIDGQEEAYEHAKRYNMQLELAYQADACHNVDRIMRVPGTINRPDANKAKKGRKEALAEVVFFNDFEYDLSEFVAAPVVQTSEPSIAQGGNSMVKVEVSGNVRPLESVDELPDAVKPSTRVLIMQGTDPADPTRYPSRSECLWRVCCDLVRAGVDDETIYAVITDPKFLISESVLGKGSGAERYALKQIRDAKEEAVHPVLRELNAKHAVISDVGGKCRIISERPDSEFGRTRISFQSFEDFCNRYCNRKVEIANPSGPPSFMPAGKWWIHHPSRRQYETVVFAPEKDVAGCYNLWKGFAYDALPGRSCDLFLAHIRDNVCSGDEEIYRYVIGWMANAVRNPDIPGQSAIVMRGRQGVGKSFFANHFGALFGRHYLPVSNSKHLIGSFNAHLRDCVVLFADEAFYAGDHRNEGILKTLVTEKLLMVEPKGVDAGLARNCIHLIMASNDTWVVPAGYNERRFLVLDVGDDVMQDGKYFRAVEDELKAGGYEALLYFLMGYDLEGFDVRTVPKTKALQEQKVYRFTTEEEWWYSKLLNGEVLEGRGWPVRYVFGTELTYDFISYIRSWNASKTTRSNSTKLGAFMRRAMPDGWNLRAQAAGEHDVVGEDGSERRINRPRVYLIPSLEECRQQWDDKFGGPFDWPDPKVVSNLGEEEEPY